MLHNVLFLLAAFYNPPFIPAWYAWAGGPSLSYCISPQLGGFRDEIVDALAEWREASGLSFQETTDCKAPRTIAIFVGASSSGRCAEALYPPPMFDEPYAGDIYIDYRWPWSVREARPHLRSLLLHEIGHSLGMGESIVVEDAMYPLAITPGKHLSAKERKMIGCLYRGICY